MYVEAWRKHRGRLPIEPLEDQIIRVVALHPEYHAVLEGDPDNVERDYTPEAGSIQPFPAHGHAPGDPRAGRHRSARQASVPSIAALAQRLGDVHEAEHRMIECLGEALWHAQRAGTAPDESAYLEALRRLAWRCVRLTQFVGQA